MRAPFGTHPYSNGWMIADEEHLAEFVARRAARTCSAATCAGYVHEPDDHDAYLEAIGIRRLVSLLV